MDERRRKRAYAVAALVRLGWRPPPLTDIQAQRLLDDMARVGRDMRGRQALNLTETERRMLMLEAQGLTRDQIAAALGRSSETVKDQEKRIRAKLGARNMPHAVALAIRQHLI